MISAPMPCSAWSFATPSATVRSASMSSPESVSSSTATCGSSIAIWRISARFFSPPEKPSLSGREVKERSTSSRSAACWSFCPNSLTRIGSSLRPVLIAMRRKFAIDTPGMATGYWKARNRPAWARSSGSAAVMSSPLNVIVPSVISYSGWPMIVEASVDLPEPLGPMRAWSSPLETDRSTPLRISRSSTRTWRLRISRSAKGLLPGLLRNELGKGGVLQRAHDREAHARPQQLGRAGVAGVGLARADDLAVGVGGDALDRGDLALERLDDLGHRDVLGRAREEVPPAGAAPALDEPGLAQPRDEVLEVGERQAVGLRDLGQRDRARAAPGGQLHEDPNAVLRLGREHHLVRKPTCEVGYQRALRTQAAQVVREAFGRHVVRAEPDALDPAGVEQDRRGAVLETLGLRAHPEGPPHRRQPRRRAEQEARPPGQPVAGQEALGVQRRVAARIDADEHDGHRAGEIVERAADLVGDQRAGVAARRVHEGDHGRAPAQRARVDEAALLVAQREGRARHAGRAQRAHVAGRAGHRRAL